MGKGVDLLCEFGLRELGLLRRRTKLAAVRILFAKYSVSTTCVVLLARSSRTSFFFVCFIFSEVGFLQTNYF